MAKLARRQAPTLFPDWFDWLETPWTTRLPFAGAQTFRIEDFVRDGDYVVRAELPGVDPDKDVEVTVEEGTLTIRAERHEEEREPHRSEFRYGSLMRTLTLPARADTDHIRATYQNGILEVDVPVAEPKAETHRVAIKKGAGS